MWINDIYTHVFCIIHAPVTFCSGYLFVCIAVCGLCLKRRRDWRERVWRRVGRRCLSYSQHESYRKSLPATIEFLLYFLGIFFSIWPLKYATLSLESKEVPRRQTGIFATVTNMSYSLSEDVLGVHGRHVFTFLPFSCNNRIRLTKGENPPFVMVAMDVCRTRAFQNRCFLFWHLIQSNPIHFKNISIE